MIKRAILEARLIEFDYFYEKGESHRRIEPYFVIFQWSSWYVFGFCLKRQDWRLFKLNRLWDLSVCDERFIMREIPPEKRDISGQFKNDRKIETNLLALFDKSAKYLLVETYGMDSFREADEGLYFEIGYFNHSYMVGWLLSFGDKVKVLEPLEVASEIQAVAKNIYNSYL